MNLKDCEAMAKSYFKILGVPYETLIFYNLPDPAGFQLRPFIGLSIPFVLLNSQATVRKAILHEVLHRLTNRNDGKAFDTLLSIAGIDVKEPKDVSPEFYQLLESFRSNKVLMKVAGGCLRSMKQELIRRIETNELGPTDFTSFRFNL